MNDTPVANRVHIGFFGRRNVGKSSLVNAVTGQDLAVVSDTKGTTTDPVYKAMELLPLGPVVIIDTPGIDDEGALGELRVRKARQVLNKTDIAVLVLDASAGSLCAAEKDLIEIFTTKKIPYVLAVNKCDLGGSGEWGVGSRDGCLVSKGTSEQSSCNSNYDNNSELHPNTSNRTPQSPVPSPQSLLLSAKTGYNIDLLKETIAALAGTGENEKRLVGDLIKPLDVVLLVVPIDKAAPKGRLILPQQQTIRDILESGAIAVVVRDFELKDALAGLGKQPALVICDSQVFAQAAAEVPPEIPLTSFSILFARYKGWLETAVRGVAALNDIQNGGTILICEGCTHHRQCDDIGTVTIPRMIKAYTGTEPAFSFCSGGDFPEDLSPYQMVIHCGACMLNDREMHYRQRCAEDQHIPFTNYGIAIAHMQGILERSITLLPFRLIP
ncbi:MAG: [FeFe] hydrogenase H-cluster maturation GTPase HydF [Treponema sp.]|nr:[FeFe] hydrogenase H-cluster maturation GTPase HydF [Treponema sp.]